MYRIWDETAPVTNGEIIVYAVRVLFHDGLFLPASVFRPWCIRIGSPVVVLAAPMLTFLLAVLINHHAFP